MADIAGIVGSGRDLFLQTFFLQLAEMQMVGLRISTFFIDRF
jgi:hypothetical protein